MEHNRSLQLSKSIWDRIARTHCTDSNKLSKLDRKSSNVAVCDGWRDRCARWKDGERMTIKKTDKEDERVTVIWVSRQFPSLTFILTWKLCCHLMPSPCHPMSVAPVTSPLSNRPCQSVVMHLGSPLTLCFFNTRYREKN